MTDLETKIAKAQEELNALVETKRALEQIETWTSEVRLRDVFDKLGLLKALGVVPVLVLYRDGTAILARHDDIRNVEPIKKLEFKDGQ